MQTKRKKIGIILVDAMFFLLLLFAPALIRLSEILHPVCPVAAVTGWMCPTCGATHALRCVLNLDFWGAVCKNGFILLLGVYLTGLLVLANVVCFSNNGKVYKLFSAVGNYKIWILFCIAAWIFAVARNLILWIF